MCASLAGETAFEANNRLLKRPEKFTKDDEELISNEFDKRKRERESIVICRLNYSLEGGQTVLLNKATE